MRKISRAWISISVAWPWAPPEGWCTMTRALGSATRLPLAPAVNRSEPIEAARPVDVEGDVLVRVLRLEEQQLRADEARHRVVDRADQENDPLFQQSRVDVVGALAAIGLLDHHRHEGVHVNFGWVHLAPSALGARLSSPCAPHVFSVSPASRSPPRRPPRPPRPLP